MILADMGWLRVLRGNRGSATSAAYGLSGFGGATRDGTRSSSAGAVRRRLAHQAVTIRIDQDVSVAVYPAVVPGQDHGRRIHLHHDGRTGDPVAGLEQRPVVDGGRAVLAIHVHPLAPYRRLRR